MKAVPLSSQNTVEVTSSFSFSQHSLNKDKEFLLEREPEVTHEEVATSMYYIRYSLLKGVITFQPDS
jgi:hypothetical protein